MYILLLSPFASFFLSDAHAFELKSRVALVGQHQPLQHFPARTTKATTLWSTPSNDQVLSPSSYSPVFNFTDPTRNDVDKFERIDDAIMGGISLSSLKQSPEEDFARWSGICRLDGGGFCGTRTLPFEQPIQVGQDAEGLYLLCRLTSDDEPERRVWKVTTRTEQSRGEQLYQAMFQMENSPEGEWKRIKIPFSSFQQVRGPRLVQDAPPLDTSNGLFQIGISLSKFMISSNVTEIPNFRPGYFELQIKEVGVYMAKEAVVQVNTPETLSKEEVNKNRPILLKLLLPVARLFFSEPRRRRQSAMRVLRNRGYSRIQASLYGLKLRAKQKGVIVAAAITAIRAIQDTLRSLLYWTLRIVIGTPILLVRRTMKILTGQAKTKANLKEE